MLVEFSLTKSNLLFPLCTNLSHLSRNCKIKPTEHQEGITNNIALTLELVIELFCCLNCLFYCLCMMIMTLIARSGVTWKCHIQRQKVNNSPKISRQRLAVIMVPPLIHVSFQLVQSCFHLYTSTHPSIHSQQSILPPPVYDYWDHRLMRQYPSGLQWTFCLNKYYWSAL